MASAGFLFKASLAFAICGEEPALLIIFLKKPVLTPAERLVWATRNALRASNRPGSRCNT